MSEKTDELKARLEQKSKELRECRARLRAILKKNGHAVREALAISETVTAGSLKRRRTVF